MTAHGGGRVCVLPGGYVDAGGTVHRQAELAPLTGREEELLAGSSGASPAARVTEVLSRCVRSIGDVVMTPEVAGALLVADRQFLMLRLREMTFGERVQGTLWCPWPQCGGRMSLDFSTTDVPVTPVDSVRALYRVELDEDAAVQDGEGGIHRVIAFRLPNGDDQAALAAVLARNPAEALAGLLERCVAGTEAPWADVADLVARMSPAARAAVEAAMEAHAPSLELEMDVRCPECGRGFTAPFHLQDFFLGELRTSRDLLRRQVHYLAWHYHWSEREILELPRDKRLAYIEILAEEIEALNNAS